MTESQQKVVKPDSQLVLAGTISKELEKYIQ